MKKLMLSTWLVVRLVCRGIELDRDMVLVLWRNEPAIEIFEAGLSVSIRRLEAKIDAVFPF